MRQALQWGDPPKLPRVGNSTPPPDKDRIAGWGIILAPKLPRLCKERAYVRCSFLLRGVTD